jgi:glycosyltransferase involved in cell wall biosynthesis
MRILMATHYFASHNGGIEIVAEQMFQQFTSLGHEVVWIAADSTPFPQPVGDSRALPIRVCNFVERKIGLPFPIPTVASVQSVKAEVNRADLVLLHDCLYLSNISAFHEARKRGVPTVIVQHIGAVPYRSSALNLTMKLANAVVTRPMLRRASQVVFISETTRQFFSDVRFKRLPEIIFNGVDSNLYHPPQSTEEKLRLRELYSLPAGRPTVLFVGRFVEKKGLAVLQHMVTMKPDYTWAFAGWGPLDPSTWRAPNVRVFSGLRGESIAALYRACDLFVLPSVGEGFPLVVQEALASGLPVICGAETISADPELGILATGVAVDPTDRENTAARWVDATEKVLKSEHGMSRAKERHEFVLRRYSWQRAADRYLRLSRNILSDHSAKVALQAGKPQ